MTSRSKAPHLAAEHEVYRPRLTWLDVPLAPEMGEHARCYRATVEDGTLRALVRAPTQEAPMWLLQVEHHRAGPSPVLQADGTPSAPLGRRPTIDELIDARAHAIPPQIAVAVLLQPSSLPPHVAVATQIGEIVPLPHRGPVA